MIDPAEWPQILRIKLGLVAALLLLTFAHDLALGPQMKKISALQEEAGSSWAQGIVRTFSWVPRLALLLALGILVAAVVLVRS